MDVLNSLRYKFTDEEYLIHQRALHKARYESATAWIKKDAANAVLIAELEKEGDFAMKNLFVIPGSRGKRIHVGTPPRWKDMITDDEEGLWILNRTYYFNTLVSLYHLTGKKEYARKVLLDLENWIDECRLPKLPDDKTSPEELADILGVFSGLSPWRSLEVGIRVFDSWNFAYTHLLLDGLMTPELHSKIARSFYEHAVVLREMSPRYWPNADHNHYLHEMLGLFLIACVFPDFDKSDDWREFAIRELDRCASAQFTEDGGQVEGSPGYHDTCLCMFLCLIEAAKNYGVALPDSIISTCHKATEYEASCIGPNGIIAPFGDTAYYDPIARLAGRYYASFGELGPAAKLFSICPEHDTDLIPESVQIAARQMSASASGEDNLQRGLDQYFARTGWTRSASQFAFMCHAPVCNGHSHIDLMTFILHLKGTPVVIDPSYYTYRECEDRKLFKSPEYHSTLTFGGKHPYEYVTRWTFTPQKEGRIRSSYRIPGVFAADASHYCYDPDAHKRLCALVGDDVFLVADDVVNETGSTVNIYFHMNDADVKIEGGVAKTGGVTVILPERVEAELAPAHRSRHHDDLIPTSRIVITDRSHATRQYLTVFTVRSDISEPRISKVPEGLRISYKQGGEEIAFLWSFASSFARIK